MTSGRRSAAAWLTGVAGLALLLLLSVSGCAVSADAETAAGVSAAAATASPTPAPAPEPEPYVPDPIVVAFSAAAHGLSAGTDGFASPESRAALEAAAAQLDADLGQVAGAPASGADASRAMITRDVDAVHAAVDGVRAHVVGTGIRVLNEETLGADQAVRDALYLAIVEQQATPVPTVDTPRLLGELVAKTRAAQSAQQAHVDEEARLAAEAAASSSSGGSGGGAGNGSGGSGELRPVSTDWGAYETGMQAGLDEALKANQQ